MHAFKSLVRSEGVIRLWRGVSTMFIGCIPAHAAYFSIYEETKRRFHVGHKDKAHPLGGAFAGVSATFAHDMIMTPCDTIKQRLQLGFYKGPLHCAKKMIKTEGLRSLYLSLPTTLSMNLPFGAIMVASNEKIKDMLLGNSLLSDVNGKHTIASYLVAGSGAGAIASIATTPLDMIKTRLQTQSLPNFTASVVNNNIANFATATGGATGVMGSTCSRKESLRSNNNGNGVSKSNQTRRVMTISHPCGNDVFKHSKSLNLIKNPLFSASSSSSNNTLKLTGAFDAAKVIYLEQGLPGFMRGCIPRLLVSAPSVAVSWTAYELAKSFLRDKV